MSFAITRSLRSLRSGELTVLRAAGGAGLPSATSYWPASPAFDRQPARAAFGGGRVRRPKITV